LNVTPSSRWSFNLNMVYTGNMQIAHFGGAVNQATDRLVTTHPFWEWNWSVLMEMVFLNPKTNDWPSA
jgi:outer membrane receptor for ferrienterochelin and colicins